MHIFISATISTTTSTISTISTTMPMPPPWGRLTNVLAIYDDDDRQQEQQQLLRWLRNVLFF
jgi:hypothetical protein